MSAMSDLVIAHTADLDVHTLHAIRALLHDAFGKELSDEDWEHALGGMHALTYDNHELVGHASVVQRRLRFRDNALRTGYVEAVAVRADHRGRGHAGAMMAALERIIAGGYEIGALGATDMAAGLYASRGWQLWRGPTSAITPEGIVMTPWEDGSIYVLPITVELDLDAELTCDWREGDAW
jgi:aminoglycoside 2'-N-acetyltransferase I